MKTKQSKILYLLSFVQLWKFFSHFGIRLLLVLYLVEYLRFSDSQAFGVNAVFCGLIELGGIVGGIIADRYLGLRRAMTLGGYLLAIGYMSILFEKGFFLSLGIIVLGGSLFRSNIAALLGQAYSENDPKRKKGYMIFYMMQNLGALVSTVICGIVATSYGFRWGFAIAASGMVIGNLMLFLKRKLLMDLGKPPEMKKSKLPLLGMVFAILGIGAFASCYEGIALPILPWLTGAFFVFFALKLLKDPKLPKEAVRKLFVYLGGLILFYAAEEQICSSLIIFAERETNRVIWGWTIPSSVAMSINPIIIIFLGTFIAKMRANLIMPFLLGAASFGILSILCLLNFHFSVFGIMGIVAIISLAELMVGPLIQSYASEVAAKGSPGIVMGMIPIAFSLAMQLGGGFSKLVAVDTKTSSMAIYGAGFGKVALVTLVGGLVLQLLIKRLSHAKNPV